MWEFATANPGYTFLIVLVLVGTVSSLVLIPIKLFFRSRNIKAQGWPPPHLDADGDFKESEDK